MNFAVFVFSWLTLSVSVLTLPLTQVESASARLRLLTLDIGGHMFDHTNCTATSARDLGKWSSGDDLERVFHFGDAVDLARQRDRLIALGLAFHLA